LWGCWPSRAIWPHRALSSGLADAQAAFNQPGLINSIEITIEPGADREAVSADVQKALGDHFRLNTNTTQIDALAALEIGFAIFNLFGLLALVLVVLMAQVMEKRTLREELQGYDAYMAQVKYRLIPYVW
jgi:hypothetical protein